MEKNLLQPAKLRKLRLVIFAGKNSSRTPEKRGKTLTHEMSNDFEGHDLSKRQNNVVTTSWAG